jgi:FixJ family two-component response regulator
MAQMTGFDVQDELARQNISLPIIFITGHGGVPMSVRAMKNGAFDFIEKPYNYRQMLDSIEEALRKGAAQFQREKHRARARALLATLSPRERDVLEKTVEGKPVKIIAFELGIAVKTVEVYRTSLREKLGVDSVAQILQIANAASSS